MLLCTNARCFNDDDHDHVMAHAAGSIGNPQLISILRIMLGKRSMREFYLMSGILVLLGLNPLKMEFKL